MKNLYLVKLKTDTSDKRRMPPSEFKILAVNGDLAVAAAKKKLEWAGPILEELHLLDTGIE